jgi:hypothetical protein
MTSPAPFTVVLSLDPINIVEAMINDEEPYKCETIFLFPGKTDRLGDFLKNHLNSCEELIPLVLISSWFRLPRTRNHFWYSITRLGKLSHKLLGFCGLKKIP